MTLAVGIVIFPVPVVLQDHTALLNRRKRRRKSSSALAAATWNSAWLPHSPSLTQGRHPCPQVSPAQSPWLAPHFIQGLSSSPCLLLLLFHPWPLFQCSGGKLGTEIALNHCGDAERASSASLPGTARLKSSPTLYQTKSMGTGVSAGPGFKGHQEFLTK